MAAYTRAASEYDRNALQRLLQTVFKDSDSQIGIFFNAYFDPSSVVLVEDGAEIAAAGYLLPVGDLVCNAQSLPCAMIYAVGALPSHRNLGYGSAVVRDLISLGLGTGYKAIVLCPSSDSLFEYYSAHSNLTAWFYANEQAYSDIPAANNGVKLAPVAEAAYRQLREGILNGAPHIDFDIRALAYQLIMSQQSGGNLFHARSPSGDACFVTEMQQDGALWIKELLTKGIDELDVLSAIAAAFPASQYIYRSPASIKRPQSGVRRFGMLLCADEYAGLAQSPDGTAWYGLAFD